MEQLWKEWIAAIKKHVPEENEYFNLIAGVTDEEIQTAEAELGFKLPQPMVEFYRAHNVEYNGVTSVFALKSSDNYYYDLLPFEMIVDSYKENLEIAEDEDCIFDDYDEKVQATSYSHTGWIPFAESRQGDYLLMDTVPSEKGTQNQIIDLLNESWVRQVIADSLEDLIRQTIVQINAGDFKHFDFILNKS